LRVKQGILFVPSIQITDLCEITSPVSLDVAAGGTCTSTCSYQWGLNCLIVHASSCVTKL